MAKASGKKHLTNNNEAEILAAFKKLAAFSDNYSRKTFDNVFVVVKTNMSANVLKAATNARLSHFDTKIYDYYFAQIERYHIICTYYERNFNFTTNYKLKNIIDGIIAVLISRIKMMIENNPNPSENQIYGEKQAIINTNSQQLFEQFDRLQQRYFDEFDPKMIKAYSLAMMREFSSQNVAEITTNMLSVILSGLKTELFEMTNACIKNCTNQLNDVTARFFVNTYYDLLGQELQIMETIINVQIQAIEYEMAEIVLNESEAEFVQNFTKQLIFSYQLFKKDEFQIETNFSGAENNSEISMQLQYFLKNVKTHTESKVPFKMFLFEQHKHNYNAMFERFKTLANVEIYKKIEHKTGEPLHIKHVYNAQKSVVENLLVAGEMIDAFSYITKFQEQNKTQLEQLVQFEQVDEFVKTMQIVFAIFETINIKIESLLENKQFLKEECAEIVQKSKENLSPLGETEKAQIAAEVFESLTKLLIDNEEKEVGASFNEILQTALQNELLEQFVQNSEKHIETLNKNIEKKIFNFKKECLLYEMITFEEIVTYSVSKLKEDENPLVCQLVSTISEASDMLFAILSKHNLTVILPKPHEMFNGKEHEVIMAEATEGFAKGEIVKVMNSGYKQDETIIIRANVIAAK